MKKKFIPFIMAMTLVLHVFAFYAQNNGNGNGNGNGNQNNNGNGNGNGNKNVPDDNWTDQRFKQWEDSLVNAMYPLLKPQKTHGNSNKSTAVSKSITSTTAAISTIANNGDMILRSATVVNNTYIPDSGSVKTNYAVGEIPMTSAVSPTGAVTYNVPIEIYPGIHGMQPHLSIAYNSMGGNGILGTGWSVSGLSSINRGNQSIWYDGKSQGIAMTNDDAFYLDGMRLIKLSATTAQIKYQSEQGNIKVTANLNGTIVKYFDVFLPDGTKGTYGSTGNTATSYLEYPLTALSDLYGNTITYTYTYANNHYRISKISYANASVAFNYTTSNRPDIITTYNGGLKIQETGLLQSIVCYYGSSILRTYSFTCTTQKDVSLLTSITLYSYNGNAFNPLKFYYGEGNTATTYTFGKTQLLQWYSWTNPNQVTLRKGKFDCDYNTQNDALIILPYQPSYWQHYRNATWFRHSQNRFDNYYTGKDTILFYAGLYSSYATPMPILLTEAGFVDIFCADLDGVRGEEIVKVNDVVSGSNDQVTFKTYSTNIYTGLGPKYATRTFTFSTVLTDADGGKSITPKFYFPGDFNGDGKTEIFAVSCNYPFGWTDHPSKNYLFNLEAGTKLYEGQTLAYNQTFLGVQNQDSATISNNSDRLYVFDYDGDGKSDLCLINATGTYIYTFDISGTTYSMRQIATYSGLKLADLVGRNLLIGEFNGDGKPDFLLSPKLSYNDWYIYYAMGNGQFEKTAAIPICTRSAGYNYTLQDVNSDGLTDILEYNSKSFRNYRAKNGGFNAVESATTFANANSIFIPTDISTGYSYHQLIALKDGNVTLYKYPRNDMKEKLLTGSITSLGVVNKNYYRMLDESSSGIYSMGYDAVYPYVNFNGSLFVLEARELYFNKTKTESLSYYYQNAVIHNQGLGFRGFGQITTYDNIRGRSSYQIFDPYNYCVKKEDDSPASNTKNTYTVSVAANKIANITLANQIVLGKAKNLTDTTTYAYDTYGNPTTETIKYGGGITETMSNSYFNNTNEVRYLIGFMTNRTKTINRNGATWQDRMYIQTHDSLGQPTVMIHYANGNQTAYETFTYDARGCPATHGMKGYTSANTLTTTYVYDAYGRETKETNPMGFNTTYDYNASNGSLADVKNHKGQATTYAYDVFYRKTGYTTPDSITASTVYSWTTLGTNGLYCIQQSVTGKPTTKTCYDALGRETASTVTLFNSSESRTDKLYDTYGRLSKLSLPFIGTAAAYWNTYAYDSYDRPTSITEASGKVTSYSYSGNSVTTTKKGIASTQNFDMQGNLISVVDPAGTITYNLRPDGQPSSIVAPGSVATSFTYDGYGRRISIVDPSAGTQSTTFDAAGNVASEKDANGKIISYVYDAYNRLTQKTRPEFNTAYAYNTDGLLASETSGNGTSTAYTYDGYGRVQTEKETAPDGKWLQKYYAYSAGNIASISYTSQSGSIVAECYYYTAGHLTEIRLNGGTSIWKLTAANAFGQPTGVTTGSFNRTYGYSAYGLPTGRTAGSFQNFTYSFDATKGNLTYRKDNVRNIQENFSYDNLNRLTGYAGKSATYNVNGNINSRSEIGAFQYAVAGKPYALSGVTTPTNLIPQRNQTVTYTSFKRPASITEGAYTDNFTYNGNDERVKMELKKNGVKELNRYYLSDCYELDDRAVGGVKEKLYLGGDFYSAPAVYVKEGTGAWNIYYICRDYLGSITHVTNGSGSVVQELSYDAWGQLRNPANQTVYAPDAAPELFLGRGYTGHEHLAMFGLVNMNARLYDAAVGRFLSPDPFVASALFSQCFNRYSYAMNNPLCYIDRDGNNPLVIIIFIVVAVAGAYEGGVIANHDYNPLHWDWRSGKTWGYMAGGAGIAVAATAVAIIAAPVIAPAVCSALGIGTGGAAGGAILGTIGGTIGGFINGAGMTALGGGNFKQTIMGGLNGAAIGGITGGVLGGAFQGIQALMDGNNFWSGEPIAAGRSAFSFNNTPINTSPPPANEPLPVNIGNVDVPEPTSPNVQKALDQLNQIQQEGGSVQVNKLDPLNNQELNMTIKQEGMKLNLRIETHPLPPKYGGDYITPMRHFNVQPKPYFPLPNNGHVLLP